MTRRSTRSLWWLALGLVCLLASAALAVAPGRTGERLLAALVSVGVIAVHVARRLLG